MAEERDQEAPVPFQHELDLEKTPTDSNELRPQKTSRSINHFNDNDSIG